MDPKTRVFQAANGKDSVILACAIFDWSTRVTDRIAMAKTCYSSSCCCTQKNNRPILQKICNKVKHPTTLLLAPFYGPPWCSCKRRHNIRWSHWQHAAVMMAWMTCSLWDSREDVDRLAAVAPPLW